MRSNKRMQLTGASGLLMRPSTLAADAWSVRHARIKIELMTQRKLARSSLAVFFIVAGTLHFVVPGYYRGIVPSYLPFPATLVAVSGAAEIAGGAGLLLPWLRQAAGIGLIVLLIVLLPANVEMLQSSRATGGPWWQELLLWLRLPFQAVLAWWVWRLSRREPASRGA
jgi:uncharacterized membrane protein